MSNAQQPDADITPSFVARQLQLQGITLNQSDLLQTTHHYKLLCSHAERVMNVLLDEHIEPAPVFHPDIERPGS